jgi:hypothetical protein
MPRQVPYPDDQVVPVIVPRIDVGLVPISPDRVRRLRENLARLLVSTDHQPASSVRAPPDGFAGRVAGAACALCKGWCCRSGKDDGFLDEATLARVPRDPMSTAAIVEMYVERVPDIGYQDSCIFHGAESCTLDRSIRSDVCNSYFCGGFNRLSLQAKSPVQRL